MIKLLFGILILLVISTNSYASQVSYDLTIYGESSWPWPGDGENPQYPTEDHNNNFWSHHYWNFDINDPIGGRDECVATDNCLSNPYTHSGIDFNVSDQNNRVLSYGFGKIIALGTPINGQLSYGQVSIRNLVNSGQYFQVNLLHSSGIDSKIALNNYIVKKQYIGVKNGIGADGRDHFGDHLHFEVSDSVNIAAPRTTNAYPCTIETLEACHDANHNLQQSLEEYEKGGLVAHYDNNTPNIRYYNPIEFAEKEELLPFVSRTDTTPSDSSFDVYGIAGEEIYGYLNISSTTIDQASILSKRSSKRSDPEKTEEQFFSENLAENLAESVNDVDGLYSDTDNTYTEGDYLFLGHVRSGTEHRYGYPVKFSVVKEGDFIIDNEKKIYTNGARYEETISNESETNTVPGYFLSAKLVQSNGTNTDVARWELPKITDDKYFIYAHIPRGATATVQYEICTPNCIQSVEINQSIDQDDWVYLGAYDLNKDSYVSLSLDGVPNGEWVAFDAIKFRKGPINLADVTDNSTFNDHIKFLMANNVIDIENPKFNINDDITQGEVLKMVVKLFYPDWENTYTPSEPEPELDPDDPTAFFYKYFDFFENEIEKIIGISFANVKKDITREEVAKIIYAVIYDHAKFEYKFDDSQDVSTHNYIITYNLRFSFDQFKINHAAIAENDWSKYSGLLRAMFVAGGYKRTDSQGHTSRYYDGWDDISRGELAKIIHKSYDLIDISSILFKFP